jgi:hypothetical protein
MVDDKTILRTGDVRLGSLRGYAIEEHKESHEQDRKTEEQLTYLPHEDSSCVSRLCFPSLDRPKGPNPPPSHFPIYNGITTIFRTSPFLPEIRSTKRRYPRLFSSSRRNLSLGLPGCVRFVFG